MILPNHVEVQNRHQLFHPRRMDNRPDGTPEAAKRIERVLTTDSGMGVIRHVDAGYEEAVDFAERNSVRIPMK